MDDNKKEKKDSGKVLFDTEWTTTKKNQKGEDDGTTPKREEKERGRERQKESETKKKKRSQRREKEKRGKKEPSPRTQPIRTIGSKGSQLGEGNRRTSGTEEKEKEKKGEEIRAERKI